MDGKTEPPAVLRGAGETGKVYPADAEHLQSSEQLADSAASERGLHHLRDIPVRRAGSSMHDTEDGRVSGQSGADLQAVRAELLRSNAIRELGKRVRAFMKEQPDIYERIYRETYGRAPNF